MMNNIFSDIHNLLIIGALVMLSMTFIVILVFNKKLINIAPAILTSSGILFTFIGIIMALYKFDPSIDSEKSINQLLLGLKFAFVPSAFAVFLAIITKFLIAKNTNINLVDEFRSDIQSVSFVLKEQLQEIGLQLANFQNDLISKQNDLFVASLQKVFDDFNCKISDKLGDSFQLLGNNIDNLCKWTIEYEVTVNQLKTSYQEALDNSKSSFEVAQKSSDILNHIALNNQKIESSIINICDTITKSNNNIEDANARVIENTNQLSIILDQKLSLLNKHVVQCGDILTMFNNTANILQNKINELSTKRVN